jgi:hypothetical protein
MKENFDDILKRKWEQKQFPVDEGHRAQMLELLDKKERRRMFPLWWLGSLVVVTALSAYFFFYQTESSGSNSPALANEKQVLSVEKRTDQGAGQIPQGQAALDQPVPNPPSNEVSSPSSSTHETSIPAEQKALTNINPNTKVSGSDSPATASKSSTSSVSNQTSGKSTNTNQTLSQSGSTIPSGQPVKATPDQASAVAVTTNSTMTSPSGNKPSIAETSTSETSGTTEVTTIELRASDVDARTPVQIGPLEMLTTVSLSYVSTVSPPPVVPDVKPDRYLSIFGEAGTGLILASQPDFTTGWKLRAGAGLTYTLQPRMQLNWSAGYLFQSGGFDFQRSSTVHQASFGARSSFNTLTPDRLHYVYTRIGGLYRFKRHFLSLHGGVQYLYGAQGEIVTQTVDQFAPGVTSQSEYSWLVTDGLQRWQWNADVAYGFQLTPGLALSAGTDIFFSSLTRKDEALSQDGYYWEGAYSPVHPFITLNYQIHALR